MWRVVLAINDWIFLNWVYIVYSILSGLALVEFLVLYVNTKFKSFLVVYEYISGQYYRMIRYINIFEEGNKLSYGRILWALCALVSLRWWWNYKDIGIGLIIAFIFLGGYVLFNKPLLVTAMNSKIQSWIEKVGDVATKDNNNDDYDA